MKGLPQVQPFSFSSNIKIGEKISMVCNAQKGDPPYVIKWLKDGIYLEKNVDINIRIVTNDVTSTIFFDPVNSNSGGNYTCEMKNKHGQDSYTALFNIKAPPEWVAVPHDLTALEGGSATLQCQAKGSPMPHVTWISEDHKILSNSSTVALSPIERVHAGKYRCTADNGLGPPLQHTVTLTVHCE
ncbi:hypothetical protein LAZ67_1007776 [Cordylochernes scorpioides]|uniref:Ig-like domain-containing protein n=1 Tax=Cordylochernes scorpioides TaxID=51811 RepID=A0ABY6K338_9ARAC|nr:hypothetical protein LAZ67_1007776 [Cordylochernes scorpioides]